MKRNFRRMMEIIIFFPLKKTIDIWEGQEKIEITLPTITSYLMTWDLDF